MACLVALTACKIVLIRLKSICNYNKQKVSGNEWHMNSDAYVGGLVMFVKLTQIANSS